MLRRSRLFFLRSFSETARLSIGLKLSTLLASLIDVVETEVFRKLALIASDLGYLGLYIYADIFGVSLGRIYGNYAPLISPLLF
jgi:hypothetical protein